MNKVLEKIKEERSKNCEVYGDGFPMYSLTSREILEMVKELIELRKQVDNLQSIVK